MRKGPYFIIQAVLSLFISTMIWYMSECFLDVAINVEELSGTLFSPIIILVIGGAIYLALTIVYIVIGAKRMDDWRPWMIAVSIVIHIAMFGLGFLASAFLAVASIPLIGGETYLE